jgi:hypothetical protein
VTIDVLGGGVAKRRMVASEPTGPLPPRSSSWLKRIVTSSPGATASTVVQSAMAKTSVPPAVTAPPSVTFNVARPAPSVVLRAMSTPLASWVQTSAPPTGSPSQFSSVIDISPGGVTPSSSPPQAAAAQVSSAIEASLMDGVCTIAARAALAIFVRGDRRRSSGVPDRTARARRE